MLRSNFHSQSLSFKTQEQFAFSESLCSQRLAYSSSNQIFKCKSVSKCRCIRRKRSKVYLLLVFQSRVNPIKDNLSSKKLNLAQLNSLTVRYFNLDRN